MVVSGSTSAHLASNWLDFLAQQGVLGLGGNILFQRDQGGVAHLLTHDFRGEIVVIGRIDRRRRRQAAPAQRRQIEAKWSVFRCSFYRTASNPLRRRQCRASREHAIFKYRPRGARASLARTVIATKKPSVPVRRGVINSPSPVARTAASNSVPRAGSARTISLHGQDGELRDARRERRATRSPFSSVEQRAGDVGDASARPHQRRGTRQHLVLVS